MIWHLTEMRGVSLLCSNLMYMVRTEVRVSHGKGFRAWKKLRTTALENVHVDYYRA